MIFGGRCQEIRNICMDFEARFIARLLINVKASQPDLLCGGVELSIG